MSRPFPTNSLRFYLTAPAPCPYLPGRRERKVFASLEHADAIGLNEALAAAGFRRSQNIAYRPACDTCGACISVRVIADEMRFSRRWRKAINRNQDLTRALRPAEATEEQFWLLKRYLLSRHGAGGMAEMNFLDYASMVDETAVRTHMVEYRYSEGPLKGELAAVALVDVLKDGLSLVYSFFDPSDERRSLGAFTILDHVLQARAAGFSYVYLGYWVRGSEKMGYKAAFQPLQVLNGGEWRRFSELFGEDVVQEAIAGSHKA